MPAVVFGGPLLGDPDRQQRTAAGSPTCAAERGAIASPPTRPSLHVGSVQTRSRCASRARVRARAVGRPSPTARLALAVRLRRPSAAPAKCRRQSHCRPLADLTSPSMTTPSAGTSKPRLGTTWDIFRRPRRLWASQLRWRDSQSHRCQQTRENGTFQPRSRTFRNVPNVPQRSTGYLTLQAGEMVPSSTGHYFCKSPSGHSLDVSPRAK
jgi:hypothetical protein